MLTDREFRACQLLLSAARRGADFDEMSFLENETPW